MLFINISAATFLHCTRVIKRPCLVVGLALLAWLPLSAGAQTLEALMAEALASHPATRAAQANQAAALAGLAAARWQYYPTPSVSVEAASVNGADSGYQGDNTVTVLRLQQPLYTGGRLQAGVRKADATIMQSQAAQDEVRLQLALKVLQAYTDWWQASLKTEAYAASEGTLQELHTRVQRRIAQGISADSDLVLAVVRLQSLAVDLSVARTQQAIALERLAQLLGRPVDAQRLRAQPVLARQDESAADLTTLLALAQAHAPGVQKARAVVTEQEALLAERRSELLPDAYVRLEQQYGNYAIAGAAAQSRVFVGLNSRLGAGLSTLSGIDAAQAKYAAALAEVDAQSRTLAEQLLADHALAQSANQRLDSLQASLRAAREICLGYDRQFLAGRKSWLDVMNAARELTQTEVQWADLQASQLLLTWRMAITVQGLEKILAGAQP